MTFTPNSVTESPQKRNFGASKFVSPGSHSRVVRGVSSAATAGPIKLTYSQRKAAEKEEEEYDRMFQLFKNKAEIEYLNTRADDKLAASVYGDAKKSSVRTRGPVTKPQTSGYDFDELLKNEPDMGLHQSWRKY